MINLVIENNDIISIVIDRYLIRYKCLVRNVCCCWRRRFDNTTIDRDVGTKDNSNNNHVDIIDQKNSCSLYKSTEIHTYTLIQLAEQNHLKILDWVYLLRIKYGISSDYGHNVSVWMRVMWTAAEHGHTALVMHCHRVWSTDGLVVAMVKAARGGHEEIVRYCHDYAKNPIAVHDINVTMIVAAESGHEHIVRICHDEWNANAEVNDVFVAAAAGGCAQLTRLIHDEWGATNIDGAMCAAASKGHTTIVQLCYNTWGGSDVNATMAAAAAGGYIDIVCTCYNKWNAREVDQAMVSAVMNNHRDIANMCHDEWGPQM